MCATKCSLVFFLCLSVIFCCLQENRVRKFYKIKNCHRSDSNVVGKTLVSSLKECSKYAGEKNALAFNYSPPEAITRRRKRPTYNCHALGCPEFNNFTGLINDTLFDYYSAYGNATGLLNNDRKEQSFLQLFSVLENATCIKSIGVFRLIYTKLNYSDAAESCQALLSDLAHILSESRTIALAKMLATLTDWYKAAFVGLNDIKQEGKYETPLGDPIHCYKYRAWSPGQPRNVLKSDDCVVLEDTKTWKIVNCKHEMASFCELYPTPPDGYKSKFLDIDCEEIDESVERDECMEYKKNRRTKRKKRCMQ